MIAGNVACYAYDFGKLVTCCIAGLLVFGSTACVNIRDSNRIYIGPIILRLFYYFGITDVIGA